MAIPTLLVWLACHFLGDFPLQGDYLAKMKATSWQHLLYHCLCYIGVFALFAHASPYQAAALFMPHFIIDSARIWKVAIPLWLDQLLHILTIVVILLWVR